ncbi:hypothetical protein ES703_114792 [subsurface metagenome]
MLALLFALNRCRRFARYIIYNAINPPNLIYNPSSYHAQHLIRYLRKISSHKVGTLNRPNSNYVLITSLITHHSDR